MSIINSAEEFSRISFDYVVVGGGTAGLAVAGRLSEDPDILVGINEVGAARLDDPSILTPAGFSAVVGNKDYDWLMHTVPQPGTNGLAHAFPRGKVLGGSSAINHMMYVRGQAAEYDDWVHFTGYSNWGWSGLKPFFMKSECMVAPTPDADHNDSGRKVSIAYETESHGTVGPIKTSFGNWSPPVENLWHEASKAMGLQWTPPKDAWSGTHLGGYSNLGTIDRSQGSGTRSYSASGYLVPNAERNNLMVLTEAIVARMILDCDRDIPAATSVVFLKEGQECNLKAKREVIITAGVVKTPQILELSGNLGTKPSWPRLCSTRAVGEAIESAGDRWTKAEREILAKRVLDTQAASIQLAVLAATVNPTRFDDQTKLLAPAIGNHRCSILAAVSHPFLRGSIHIQSTDPTAQPRIDPQYLQSNVDVEVLSVCLRIADEMFRTKLLADEIRGRVIPAPDMDMDDLVQREDYIRKHTGTEYYPCGTAALGQVVDERLRVFNVGRLRVVDASIIPLHLSGNVCALVYAIAEKAADMIKEDQA